MAQLAAFWAKLTMLVSTIRFSDIVDILIVAYLIYNVIMLIRKTNSYRLAQGVLLILIALWLSGVLKLTMFNRILQKTVELGLIALVIIFQPELRRLLGLRSTDIEFSPQEDGVTVTTHGFGHRVGLSQYGAEAMAQAGRRFDEILLHYYQGTEIRRLTLDGEK